MTFLSYQFTFSVFKSGFIYFDVFHVSGFVVRSVYSRSIGVMIMYECHTLG